MNLFSPVPGYEPHIYDGGKEALFLLFLAFLLAFALTRLYTRLARVYGWGSASVGGVHLHHAVPGLVLALGAGLLAFTPWGGDSPAQEALAIAFGVGAALVLDEWALIFHLDDVYWSQEGRSSVDAVIIGSILAGILLHTASPFGLQESEYPGPRTAVFALLALNYLFALVCFFKGKPVAGAVGLLVPLVAFVGAARLAKPHSPWSRWFYEAERGPARLRAERTRKLERARRRYDLGWQGRLERKVSDLIGGAPSGEPPDGRERTSA
ncbi:MAG: hypothetical protein ACRDNI_02165 [Gaiellaceae bacterium]